MCVRARASARSPGLWIWDRVQAACTVPAHALVDRTQRVPEDTQLSADILYMQIKISAGLFISLDAHLIYILILSTYTSPRKILRK